MSEGKLPLGWRDGLLSDIAQINPFVSYTGLNDDDEVTFLSMADVGENGRIIGKQDRSLQSIRFGFTRFQEGDVLFAKITPCMENGKGAFATPLRNRYGAGSTEFHVLRAKESGDPEFIYHVSLSPSLRNRAVAFFTGSAGQQRVSADFFSRYRLLLPPISEQRKIARILTTVDNLIEKTEALIAKYQAVKQGMMHDLFTRGVDENGHLRPTYEEAPHLYKPSELGWIPKEWKSKTLNDLVSPSRPIVYGILMPGYGYPGGIPVIKVKDIKNGVIDTEDLLLTSPEIDQQYRRSKTKTDDLLFTIRGTVGRTAFVPPTLDGANITQDTARIGIVDGDARFIRGYLEMPVPARFVATRTLGVAVQGINLGDVRKIPIAYPHRTEQSHIGDILELQDKRLNDERGYLAKLQTLKNGLMQDLLTGKVRVKVDESEENTAHA